MIPTLSPFFVASLSLRFNRFIDPLESPSGSPNHIQSPQIDSFPPIDIPSSFSLSQVLYPQGYFKDLSQFEKKFFPRGGFQNKSLLLQSFLTAGYRNAPKSSAGKQVPGLFRIDNERLEFLGDSVLRFLAATWGYQKYPRYDQVQLTRLLNFITSNSNLRDLAQDHFKLCTLILDSQALENKESFTQFSETISKAVYDADSALIPFLKRRADTVESLIAATYIDRGLEYCSEFVVTNVFEPSLKYIDSHVDTVDTFSDFCIQFQKKYRATPKIQILSDTGKGHSRSVSLELLYKGRQLWTASGNTIPEARFNLAIEGLNRLENSE